MEQFQVSTCIFRTIEATYVLGEQKGFYPMVLTVLVLCVSGIGLLWPPVPKCLFRKLFDSIHLESPFKCQKPHTKYNLVLYFTNNLYFHFVCICIFEPNWPLTNWSNQNSVLAQGHYTSRCLRMCEIFFFNYFIWMVYGLCYFYWMHSL